MLESVLVVMLVCLHAFGKRECEKCLPLRRHAHRVYMYRVYCSRVRRSVARMVLLLPSQRL